MGRKEMEKLDLTDLLDVCAYISIDNLHIQHWIYAFRQRSQCCNRNEIPRDVVTHFLMIPYTDPIFQVRNGNCPDDVHFRTSRHRQRLRQRSRPDVHHECIVFFCIDSAVHVYHRHTTFPTISQTDIIRGMHRFYFRQPSMSSRAACSGAFRCHKVLNAGAISSKLNCSNKSLNVILHKS